MFIDGTKLQVDANIYSFTWKKAIDRYESKLNENVEALSETMIQSQVNICLSKEQLGTSEGIETLIEAIGTSLEAVEESIQEETQISKGGSIHKRRRRLLKNTATSVSKITFRENSHTKKSEQPLTDETVIPKRIKTLPSCV